MGDPLEHARSSAKKFGGTPQDYMELHKIMDSSKLFLADWRHRSVLHNTFGIYLMENFIIGSVMVRKSDGEGVCTRTIVTQHIIEDLNMVPTLGEFLREMPLRRWMMRATRKEVDRLKNNTISDEGNVPTRYATADKETRISASIIWTKGDPPEPGWYLVDRATSAKSEADNCPALYFLGGKWYIDSEDMMPQPAPDWWAKPPLDPILDGKSK